MDEAVAHPMIDSNHIPGVTSLELAVNYKVRNESGEAHLGAENCLDKDPPLVAGSRSSGFYQGQSKARCYARLGCRARLGMRVRF
jgi:hypothetical protein